ncbi:MAG: hypothetical protein IKZ49_00095 [Alphaproteobacteria bacterium]|nr:hypothetical protein [Alphaproteobacteria bacterium]
MNIKSSLFAILSAVPCMTLCIGDAMAASCKYAGWYRWRENGVSKDWCMPCPAGCYCPKAADDMDRAPNQWMSCTSGLQKYGIYKCDDGYTSVGNTGINPNTYKTYWQGAMSDNECFFKAKDTGNKVKYSRAETCPAGQYIKAGYEKCQTCKTGYICPGVPMLSNGTKVKVNTTWNSSWKKSTYKLWPNPNRDDGIYLCPSGTVANSNHTDCVKKDSSSSSSSNSGSKVNCKAGQYLPANATSCKECKDRYYCLGGSFTTGMNSDQGLRTCVFSQPNKNKTACEVRCLTGKYLPANSYSCQTCKDRYYCRGGWFSQHTSYDQGALFCSGVVNETKSMCIRNGGNNNGNSDSGNSYSQSQQRVHCNAGQYLPANATDSSQCQTCKDRYYCLGGSFPVASYDQGLRTCPYNAVPNASRTKCEYGVYQCEPGTYMPAKGQKCITCPSTKNYCPGGNFKPSDYDQGKKICPGNTIANTKRSACILTLTKDQMQYGMSGKDKNKIALDEQCWTRTDMNDYVYCMFGGKMNVAIQERYYKS